MNSEWGQTSQIAYKMYYPKGKTFARRDGGQGVGRGLGHTELTKSGFQNMYRMFIYQEKKSNLKKMVKRLEQALHNDD